MKDDAKARARARGGLRRFITVWAGLMLLGFVSLCVGQTWLVSRLHSQAEQLVFDGESLRISGAFGEAVLSEALQAPGGMPLLRELQDSEASTPQLLRQLQQTATSPQEGALVGRVTDCYLHWQVLEAGAPRALATQQALRALLHAVRQHRDLNARQMLETQAQSAQLDRRVDAVSLSLIGIASALLLLGSVELWSRLFRPLQELAGAAQLVGSGDLQARAPVGRPDEMGHLARVFNDMAGAMEERERERLQFVATVAHDLKNPLVVIGGGAHLLQRLDLNEDERKEWLQNIVNHTRRMEAMISDLTDGVQAQTGRLNLQIAPLDFARTVREAVKAQGAVSPAHQLVYEGAAECPLPGDIKRLERVVSNLLSNAVKYSKAGCRVTATLEVVKESAVLRVCDEGIGIAPEDLPRLFLPFSRLEQGRAMATGTGLGLSSVKKIIEAHGGTIAIQSAPGAGTTVEVRLPLRRESGSRESVGRAELQN